MKNKNRSLCILSFFIFIHSGYTQQQDSLLSSKQYRFNKAYVKSYWYDTRDIIISPLYWKKNQWIGFASVTVAASLVYLKDEQIQKTFQVNRSHGGDQFSKYFLEPWGSGIYSASLMAALYIEGLIFKNERSKKMALLGTKTLILTSAAVLIPKYAFQRHRPYQDSPPQPMTWEGPFHGFHDFTSFPSGHSVSAFAMATVIASEYSDHWAVPIIAYTLAGATTLSRLYDNKHWASDALVGAVFGYAMGKLIYNKDNWINGKKKRLKKENFLTTP